MGTCDAGKTTLLLAAAEELRAIAAVQQIVERNLRAVDMPLRNLRITCFHPAPPKPEHRVIQ